MALKSKFRENPTIQCKKPGCYKTFTKYYVKKNGKVEWSRTREYCCTIHNPRFQEHLKNLHVSNKGQRLVSKGRTCNHCNTNTSKRWCIDHDNGHGYLCSKCYMKDSSKKNPNYHINWNEGRHERVNLDSANLDFRMITKPMTPIKIKTAAAVLT